VSKTPSLPTDRTRVSNSTSKKTPAEINSGSKQGRSANHKLLEERLQLLHVSLPELAASIIVSLDGITLASALPASVKEQRVSAMTAIMVSLGERIAGELGRGTLDQVYIKGKIGHVVLISIGGKAVLTTIARENAKVGLLFLDLQRAALEFEKLI
jgi:predicted regulator of Ras-like GTPase activity (Roadblock/LC7/MglB family)